MKANKTTRGKEASNHRRRKVKQSESSIGLTAYNQILKQEKQLDGRNRHLPININTECQWSKLSIKRHQLANWIKKEDPKIYCLQETHLIDRNKNWFWD
jgi:hypothetical protein